MPGIWTLRARYLFPMNGRPIAGGRLTVQGATIVEVSRHRAERADVDLDDDAVVPGLVNTHTHLELSHQPTPLGEPGMPLPTWLKSVVELRRRAPVDPIENVRAGLSELTKSGVVAVGDIVQPGWSVHSFQAAAMHATVFQELIGLSPQRAAAARVLAEAHLSRQADYPGESWRGIASGASGGGPLPALGLSPHAPYSARWELFEHVASRAALGPPVSVHLAESAEEIEFLQSRKGPFRDLLEELGVWREDAFAVPRRARDYLELFTKAKRFLVIHGNYLADEEIAWLGQMRDRMAVVFCPRTHDYFRHAPYPLARFVQCGVRMALGTDSRASNPNLNLWEEFRFAAKKFPTCAPETFLEWATRGGAMALELADRLGSLSPGMEASFAVVRLPPHGASDPHELLLDDSAVPVAAIRGGAVRHDPFGLFRAVADP